MTDCRKEKASDKIIASLVVAATTKRIQYHGCVFVGASTAPRPLNTVWDSEATSIMNIVGPSEGTRFISSLFTRDLSCWKHPAALGRITAFIRIQRTKPYSHRGSITDAVWISEY